MKRHQTMATWFWKLSRIGPIPTKKVTKTFEGECGVYYPIPVSLLFPPGEQDTCSRCSKDSIG